MDKIIYLGDLGWHYMIGEWTSGPFESYQAAEKAFYEYQIEMRDWE